MKKLNSSPYIFISPFYISFIVFAAFPILFSIILSFHSWNGIGQMKFNGLNNYLFLFKDPLFWKTIGNTIAMLLIGAIPCNIMALIFAYILNQFFIKLKNTFKSQFYHIFQLLSSKEINIQLYMRQPHQKQASH